MPEMTYEQRRDEQLQRAMERAATRARRGPQPDVFRQRLEGLLGPLSREEAAGAAAETDRAEVQTATHGVATSTDADLVASNATAEGNAQADGSNALKSPEETERAVAEEALAATGPVGAGDYVVRQGECISSIAKKTGHFWETIWTDAANSELREARQDPNVLLPEDRVHVPDLRRKAEPGATEIRHRFVRKGQPTTVDLRILDDERRPRAFEPYRLEIDNRVLRACTDGNGHARAFVPADVHHLVLVLERDGERFPIAIRHLNPITEPSGLCDRLRNLGYTVSGGDGSGSDLAAAIRAFQHARNLPESGRPDTATRAALLEAHGS